MRDQMFQELPREWIDAYEAGCFTEFMEQRAPGHTVADGKIYRKGLLDFKAEIGDAIAALDFERDPGGPGQARGSCGPWRSPATR